MARANPATGEFPFRYYARRPLASRGKTYSWATSAERDYHAAKARRAGYRVECYDVLTLFHPESPS